MNYEDGKKAAEFATVKQAPMTIVRYQAEAENTKSSKLFSIWPSVSVDAVGSSPNMPADIAHAIIGISTEGGELLDVLKKAMFYGKPIDYVNLDEEIGDVMWYIAIYCNARGTTIEKLCEINNAKLKARFPEKFTQHHAINRDLDAERQILESGVKGGDGETGCFNLRLD